MTEKAQCNLLLHIRQKIVLRRQYRLVRNCRVRGTSCPGAPSAKHPQPQRDSLFTKGPSDVLDHATSEMASGSKLGLDATKNGMAAVD
jgi:hypothetical protein